MWFVLTKPPFRGENNMKKYICPNCGFVRRYQTKDKELQRKCKNCGAFVYNSKVVLEAIMKCDVLSTEAIAAK